MRAVFGLVLVLGMGLAGFAVYMVKGYMTDQEAQLAAERARAQQVVPTTQVYAVTRPILYGEPITAEDVELINYVEAALPEGVFATEEELFPEGPDVQRVAIRRMDINEPVLAAKVSEPGEVAGITQALAPGTRAFTINVDAASGVSGFLRPGDKVDVYWSGTVGGGAYGAPRDITRLIQPGVKIIAVDRSTDSELVAENIPSTVTVEVDQNEALGLAQLRTTGSLSLSLVGNGDQVAQTIIEVDQASLLGIEAIAPALAPAPVEVERTCSIRQRKGAEVIETPIPCTN